MEKFIIALVVIAVVVLIVGYVVKKRIPTNKFSPCIVYMGEREYCKIKVKTITRILPFATEKAVIDVNNSALKCSFPDLRIQATGKNRFRILNAEKILRKPCSICGEHLSKVDAERVTKRVFSYRGFTMSNLPKPGEHAGQFLFEHED